MLLMVTAGVAGAHPSAAPGDHNLSKGTINPLISALYPPAAEGPIHRAFAHAGPHQVTVSQTLTNCDDLVGRIEEIGGALIGAKVAGRMKCTQAFPHGTRSPIGMLYYYPSDLQSLPAVPALVWAPGLTADGGQYDPIARLWASRGFVVAIPYNFVNSTSTEHFWGTQALIREEARVSSPLHGRIDLSRTVLGGHSGGAGSLIWAASYMPPIERRIDARLHIVGALSVATGVNGPIGSAIRIPTLTITGTRDVVTPPFLWPYWAYATMTVAPAYIAPIVNAGHESINSQLSDNPGAGLSTAWLEHLTGGHPDADAVFLGPRWTLAHDPAFIDVKRNAAAARL